MENIQFKKYYEKIINIIKKTIPVKYEIAYMYSETIDYGSKVSLYFETKDGIIHHSDNIVNEYKVSEKKLETSIFSLLSAIQDLWEQYHKVNESWEAIILELDKDKNFKVEFNYNVEKYENGDTTKYNAQGIMSEEREKEWAFSKFGNKLKNKI